MRLLEPCSCTVVRSLAEEEAHLLEGLGEGIFARHDGLVSIEGKPGVRASPISKL